MLSTKPDLYELIGAPYVGYGSATVDNEFDPRVLLTLGMGRHVEPMPLRVTVAIPSPVKMMDCYPTPTRLLVVSQRFGEFLLREVPRHTQLLPATSNAGEWAIWNVVGLVGVEHLYRLVPSPTTIARCAMEVRFPRAMSGIRVAPVEDDCPQDPLVFRVRSRDGAIEPSVFATQAFVDRVLAAGLVGPGFLSLSEHDKVISPGRDASD